MAQGFSWQLGRRGKVLLALGLLLALACLGLALERDGNAPVAAVNTAAVVPAALGNVSPAVKARVDKSVAQVNRLKVAGSPAVAKQKVKSVTKTEVDKAVKSAKEKLGVRASQFSIGGIVCPVLQFLRASFGPFFGGIFDGLLAAFGCLPVPSDPINDDDSVSAPTNPSTNPSTNRPPTNTRPLRVRPNRRLLNRRPALGSRLLPRGLSTNNR